MIGIEEVMSEEQQPDDLARQKALNAKLVERIQELEARVQHLEAHIRQLEQEHHTHSPHNLKAQIGALTISSLPHAMVQIQLVILTCSRLITLLSSDNIVLVSLHSLNAWVILH